MRIKESISTGAGVITKQSLDIQQGFAAEAHHTGSYNIEAAGKGANNHRATMDVGQRNDPVTDIRINTPEGSKDYQLKFYKTGEESATAFNHGKYENVGKIVPEEQLGEARKTAQRRADRNAKSRPEVSKNYKNTAEKLDDSIHSDDRPDIKSKPLSRKGEGSSEELVKEAKKEGKGPEYADIRFRRSRNCTRGRGVSPRHPKMDHRDGDYRCRPELLEGISCGLARTRPAD